MDARRLAARVSAWLCGIGGALMLCAAPAMAANAPTVEGESLAKVTATSATLQAQIDPQGSSTEYHFEYGRCASACASSGYETSIPVPDAAIGSESAVVEVSAHPQDLTAGSVYHMRVVASNENGTTDGEEKVFTTQPASAVFQLPDSRAWEMVSPPQKEGSMLGVIEEGIVQASADGNAFSDWSFFEPLEEKAEGAYGFVEANYFGRGPDGWVSKTLTPPHKESGFPPVGNGQEYRMFSEDLSKSILQPFGVLTPLVPEVGESTPYLRTDYLNGNPGEPCSTDCYLPLVTSTNVPAGTKFGEEPEGKCERVFCGPTVVGGSSDLSQVILESRAQLTSTPNEGRTELYEWFVGKLQLVSLLPSGEENENGGSVAVGPELGDRGQSARNAISRDGSRVIWTGATGSFNGQHLFMTDLTAKETIRIDAPNTGVPPEAGPPVVHYMTASDDDSRVFFISSGRLTEDSTAKPTYPEELDLYEFNLNAPAGGRLTDLSIDANLGESAGVSMVTGVSEDGSYVYFTASGALAAGSAPGKCGGNSPQQGETQLCNLYVRHGGVTKFIAGLSAEDFPDWSASLSHLPVRVSPNGRWLAFMSNRNLTGYDMTDAISGTPDEEVYLYDAALGKLTCASCNPTGSRPVGFEYGNEGRLVTADRVFDSKTWIASNVPPWTRFNLTEVRYQSRYLSNSGRLFFDSHDALSPQDVNGVDDVYEFEPTGVGDCAASNASFSASANGCVTTVSSGTSNEESAFIDASETGGDVFFITSAKLASQDFDNTLDIYDTRECAPSSRCIPAPPATPPPCSTGDSCKASPTPQPAVFGAPASATFAGIGNVTPSSTPSVKPKGLSRAQKLQRALKSCHRKRKRRQRMACERKAHRLYGFASKANFKTRSKG